MFSNLPLSLEESSKINRAATILVLIFTVAGHTVLAQDSTAANSSQEQVNQVERTVKVPVRLLNKARRAAGKPVLRPKSSRDSVTMRYEVSLPRSGGLFEWLTVDTTSRNKTNRTRRDTPPVREAELPEFHPDTSRSTKSAQQSSDARRLIEGITYNGITESFPADAHGAVGLNHVCHVVNTAIECHTKDGSSVASARLNELFEKDEPDDLFDPKIIYDSRLDRYVLVVLNVVDNGSASENKSEIYLAASDDANPSGTWNFQVFDASINMNVDGQTTECWFDYPGFSVDEDAIYLTGNYYAFESEEQSGLCDSQLAIFDKGLIRGSGSEAKYLGDPHEDWAEDFNGTLQPASVPAGGTPGGDIGTWIGHYNGITIDGNEYWLLTRVEDPLNSPTFKSNFVFLGNFDATEVHDVNGQGVPDAPQPETSARIETNNRRLLDLVWRNETLWGTTTVVPSEEATATAVKIDVTDLGVPLYLSHVYLSGENIESGAYTYYPSVAVGKGENAAIGFSLSGPDTYANSYLVTWRSSGSKGPTYLAARDPYRDPYIRRDDSDENRWGDYSDVEIDPVDGSVWTINQVAADRVTACLSECGAWKVYVANFSSSKLPVELASFDARTDGGKVHLTWQTVSETGNARFEVQRRALGTEQSANQKTQGQSRWKTVGSVEGSGTTTEARSYRFTDKNLPYQAERLAYRLRQVDVDGTAHYTRKTTVQRRVSEVQLLGTYPNPASQKATIQYALPETRKVSLRLYDMLGREVRTLVRSRQKGRHKLPINLNGLPSGTYFLRLTAGGQVRTQKLTVLR